MSTFRVRRVQHVSLPRPYGSNEQVRHFYGHILGLGEIPPPASLSDLDLIWYRIGDDELHLFADEQPTAHPGQHFCIEVDDLQALRRQLSDAGVTIHETTPIPGRPRLFINDPFGNRIELSEIHDADRSWIGL